MRLITYSATDPNGEVHQRVSEYARYTHAVVILNTEEASSAQLDAMREYLEPDRLAYYTDLHAKRKVEGTFGTYGNLSWCVNLAQAKRVADQYPAATILDTTPSGERHV